MRCAVRSWKKWGHSAARRGVTAGCADGEAAAVGRAASPAALAWRCPLCCLPADYRTALVLRDAEVRRSLSDYLDAGRVPRVRLPRAMVMNRWRACSTSHAMGNVEGTVCAGQGGSGTWPALADSRIRVLGLQQTASPARLTDVALDAQYYDQASARRIWRSTVRQRGSGARSSAPSRSALRNSLTSGPMRPPRSSERPVVSRIGRATTT